MGEWGQWWSNRGHDTVIKCDFCGRNVSKHKAVEVRIGMRMTPDVYSVVDYVSVPTRKGYACISCAKHRNLVKDGIHTTEKDRKARKKAKDKREMDKVMKKVKDIETKEKAQKSKPKENAGVPELGQTGRT